MTKQREPESSIVVLSDVAPDGSYVVTIQFGADEARVLDWPATLAYAAAVLAAAQRAEYDAAVLAQISGLGVSDEAAARVVTDLRAERPPLPVEPLDPLELVPGVSHRDRRGFLTVKLHGEAVGQWEVADARAHALACLEVTAAAELDGIYRKTLVGVIGVDDATARALIGELAAHRPA